MNFRHIVNTLVVLFILLVICSPVWAGNIDPENSGHKYAWGENVGWISFDPSNGGVFHDGNGNLSGYAWGENTGWIKFDHAQASYLAKTSWQKPEVSFSLASQSGAENLGTITLTAQLSRISAFDVLVPFTVSGSATGNGTDYTITENSVTIAAGATTQNISITLNDDSLDEDNETVIVAMGFPENADQGTICEHIATIADDDTSMISISDVMVTEPDSALVNAVFTISLSLKNTRTVNVSYVTADNTATGGSDYITIVGTTISFAPLETSKQITAQINGDFFDEENESFFVNLSNAVNATIDDNQGVCNIEDNDTAGFIISDKIGKSVNESGTTDTFNIALSAEPESNVVIDPSSTDSSEASISPASLTFTPANWTIAQNITITGVNDTIIDGDQTTAINLSINDGSSDDHFDSVVDQSLNVITIDNDTAGFIVTEKIGKSVNESGTTDAFNVALSAKPDSNVVIDISSADSSEAIISPDSLTFTPANWNTAQNITITGVDDTIIDGNQTTAINLSVNDGASDNDFDLVGDHSLDVTTTDDEKDSDNDGMSDAWEDANNLDPGNPDDGDADDDGDGLSNFEEFNNGTDPGSYDSDGDGFSDGVELAYGSDPGSGDEKPEPPSEVWVDDGWKGLLPGDDADGHIFEYNAFAKIQPGMDIAAVNATINIREGLYRENIVWEKDLVIKGTGFSSVLDGDNAGAVISTTGLSSGSKLENLVITAGKNENGGGIYNTDSQLEIYNSVFMQNTAEINGGGVFNDNSSIRLINCTFTQNHAGVSGGPVFNSSSNPVLVNCILWGNSPTGMEIDADSSAFVSYSDVQGGWPGNGNIDSDPLFDNGKNCDVHLKTGSPCIDTGDNAAAGEIVNDFEDESRLVGIVDMGVDEWVDTDSDSMPDYWEKRYWPGEWDGNNAGSDNDNDGVVNLDEYIKGLDPTTDEIPVAQITEVLQTVGEGVDVVLCGSGSFDPDGGITRYLWEQIPDQTNTMIAINNSNQPEASFTTPLVDKGGQAFVFKLTVKDKAEQSSSASCIVNVSWDNHPPEALAGIDQRVNGGERVQLDGSGSTDHDGSVISCGWEQITGFKVELFESSQLTPFFIAPYLDHDEKLVFKLTIIDADGLQSFDSVEIMVSKTGDKHNSSDLGNYLFDPVGELNCFINTSN